MYEVGAKVVKKNAHGLLSGLLRVTEVKKRFLVLDDGSKWRHDGRGWGAADCPNPVVLYPYTDADGVEILRNLLMRQINKGKLVGVPIQGLMAIRDVLNWCNGKDTE